MEGVRTPIMEDLDHPTRRCHLHPHSRRAAYSRDGSEFVEVEVGDCSDDLSILSMGPR